MQRGVGRSGLLGMRGMPSQVIAEFEKATAVNTRDPRAYYHLAMAYHQVGEEEKSANKRLA